MVIYRVARYARVPSTRPKNQAKRTEEELRPSRQVGLRFSSLLLFSKPLLVIADKRLFIDSPRVNVGALFIYLAENNFPKLSIRTQQRIHDRTAKSFAEIRIFYNAYPLACFALIFINSHIHSSHAPFICHYSRKKYGRLLDLLRFQTPM